ncbi:WhiB family transcriptional regulator [Actinomadura hibisca]|uniref:WhiB family transcriptional regulator n=1 Tax=Actinomadura hibisca TaxID=68565 RepID=UPI00082E1067|nr:WhiB family transcriptional regulator [Actinomadura hibisca]
MKITKPTPPPKLRWSREPAGWDSRPCLGTPIELWFGPDNGHNEHWKNAQVREQEAKKLCQGCPFAEFCLETELALGAADQHGVRGGLTASERRTLIDRRARRSTGTGAAA